MFRAERDCFEFIVRSRWPEGEFKCPSCGSLESYAPKDRLAIICAACKHIQSATAGTVMHGSRLPLSSWLLATWLLVTDKRGISAKYLERTLGVSYETAYMMLQRLRTAMVNPDRSKLTGRVEVDESYIGGPEKGKRGRGAGGKNLVVGAVEVCERTNSKTGKVSEYAGRVRFRHIDNAIQPVLVDFALDTIEGGTKVVTDGSEAYPILTQFGYSHEVESTARGMEQDAVLRHYHRAVANLKTWIKGTFHGRIEGKHLQGYLNEFAFRFNRRNNLAAAFQTILGLAPKVAAPTYAEVYAVKAGKSPPARRHP